MASTYSDDILDPSVQLSIVFLKAQRTGMMYLYDRNLIAAVYSICGREWCYM